MFRRLLTVCLVGLLAGGLTFSVASATAQEPPPERGLARGMDRAQLDLADRFPGFGGMYRDPGGQLVVVLQDRSRLPEIEATLGPVVAVRGDHDFRDLYDWRASSRPRVLARDSIVLMDVDETSNRVRVGVDRAAGQAGIRQARRVAARAGIPTDALVVELVDPIVRVQTLRDSFRPVPGGVQIRFGGFLCTLGFNADRGGVSGFVTNSHCTDKQGGVSRKRPTLYYQPLDQVPSEFIGTERVDPKYFKRKNGCPRGANCRFSDSAWAEYDAASLSGGDSIAKTTGLGSLDVAGSYSITGTANGASVGTTVNKVGRTTGWTQGAVSASCVDTGVSGSNIVLLCQDFVDAGVGGGDSGSPVFTESGGNATLVGLLWGGNGDGTLFVYSPYDAVKSELGID